MKKILVVSTAPLIKIDGQYSAYSPYANELAIWAKYSDQISICSPVWLSDRKLLNSKISFPIEKVVSLHEFSVKSIFEIPKAISLVFQNLRILFTAFKSANHLHLRCPGNIGLLGCIVQMFYPRISKSAKYAGNWDPEAKQPFSYRLQKWILSNTFLTKNMTALVYGNFPNQSSNVKSFFTASYSETERVSYVARKLNDGIKFIFVGALVEGKRPLYALMLVHELKKNNHEVFLDFYGEGPQRKQLENYIIEHNLSSIVTLHGNQSKETLVSAYKKSHFLLLPSRSEGWPKAVAEAMFFGCVPVATKVSCVEDMLDYGKRGVLLSMNEEDDVAEVKVVLENQPLYQQMSKDAMQWSQNYTLEKFEIEIQALIQEKQK